MTAVERLRAAVARLEALKADSTPGPVVISDGIGEVTDSVQGGFPQEADAELIVTLHRTIDAQIAILNVGAEDAFWGIPPSGAVLALADAVLGGAE